MRDFIHSIFSIVGISMCILLVWYLLADDPGALEAPTGWLIYGCAILIEKIFFEEVPDGD